MTPQVAAIAGPLHGRVFPITGAALSVGRAPSNDLAIPDPSVSRQHCVIVRRGAACIVRDADSRNGTYVNGLPISERALHHGDEVQIGNSVMVFLENVPVSPVDVGATIGAGSHSGLETVTSTMFARPLASQTPLMPRASAADTSAYDTLIRITTVLAAIRGFVRLGRPLLALLGDILPAKRGVLVLGTSPRDVEDAVVWQRDGEGGGDVDSALVADIAQHASGVLSLKGTTATVAAPLRAFERVVGVIYFEGALDAFTPEHVALLTAVASVAGLSAHSAREIEWLEADGAPPRVEATFQMVGRSAKMRQVCDFIMKVAPTEATTLIGGESGTGKELVARAIHRNSGRAGKPFVAINCAALAESLIESELFGYEKGAFTGAIARRPGKLEAAHGGTVFLDEIGELPLALQSKLLRVLQEREFERVGGTQTVKVDVRIVAATNRDLERAVKDGTFRQDLYYRLNVVSITLAPLRDRREDILPLAKHFAAHHAERCKRRIIGISEDAAACLTHYDWPGNVRELENAIERAVVMGSGPMIGPDDLGEMVLDAQPDHTPAAGFHDAVRRAKRQLIVQAFEQTGGRHAEAARLLGLQSNYLHRLIRVLNLRDEVKLQGRPVRRAGERV